ncbi:MAG: hypothetical protein ACR2L2_20890 [Acidobacteriota bacterium]
MISLPIYRPAAFRPAAPLALRRRPAAYGIRHAVAAMPRWVSVVKPLFPAPHSVTRINVVGINSDVTVH